MGFNYGNDPGGDPVDFVRFKCGDTDATDWFLSDEEIGYLVTAEAPLYAAASACEAIAAKFTRRSDKEAGKLKIASSQRATNYLRMASRLRQQAALQGVVPFAGGMSYAAKDALLSNPDFVEPAFTRDMYDGVDIDPRTGGQRAAFDPVT